jgi:hypothetical protein
MQQKDRIASIDVRGNEILDDDVVLMRLKIAARRRLRPQSHQQRN